MSNGCWHSIVVCVFLICLYLIRGEIVYFICSVLSYVGFLTNLLLHNNFLPWLLFWLRNQCNLLFHMCSYRKHQSVANIWKHSIAKRLLLNFASVKLATITKEFAPVPFTCHIIIMNRLKFPCWFSICFNYTSNCF